MSLQCVKKNKIHPLILIYTLMGSSLGHPPILEINIVDLSNPAN